MAQHQRFVGHAESHLSGGITLAVESTVTAFDREHPFLFVGMSMNPVTEPARSDSAGLEKTMLA
jgi:hypothetical protein